MDVIKRCRSFKLTVAIFESFQPLTAIAVTPAAALALSPLHQVGVKIYVPAQLSLTGNYESYDNSLGEFLPQQWQQARGLIFCLAVGAVVRLIAPLLKDKETDPAVLVVDPQRTWVLCLCGGHRGHGDRLTDLVAEQLGASPILTGASQDLGYVPLDTLGEPWGWQKGTGDWIGISAALARQKLIEVHQESGDRLWQSHIPPGQPLAFEPQPKSGGQLWITPRQLSCEESPLPQAQWHPRVLWVGIGCVRGTSQQFIAQALHQVFHTEGLSIQAIAAVATLDLKADEIGLLAFCQQAQLPLQTFAPATLNAIPVPNPSDVVAQEVGTASVAEAAAIAGARPYGFETLRIPKQIFKQDNEALTIAVAQAQREFNPQRGALWLIGSGPGDLAQLTVAARTALQQAQVWIGYGLYLDLLQPLQRPGQIIEAFAITQERTRAQRAIALAQQGLQVAVISSGDCGIYGMAGLVLEELQKLNWDGQTPRIEVFPGITALQAAAARVGTPLMHDFCAISLSDLLTPSEKIWQRLQAAAQADFVTALYNPQSQKRTQLIIRSQEIFLQWRSPTTPVALVRGVYRSQETIVKTTLEQMLTFPIDMLTIVLIGNSTTYKYQDFLITPRGY